MNIKNCLDEKSIIAELSPGSKKDILRELAGTLTLDKSGSSLDDICEKLIEREELSTTGIGEGIAIPHCKDDNIDSIVMALGRSTSGLDFDSIDGQPINLFFLLVAPTTQKAAGDQLRTLGKITRMLRGTDIKRKLLEAKDASEIFRLISEEDEKS